MQKVATKSRPRDGRSRDITGKLRDVTAEHADFTYGQLYHQMKHIQKFAGNLQNLVISRVVLVKHSALLSSPYLFLKIRWGCFFLSFFLAPVGALNLWGSFDSFPNSAR